MIHNLINQINVYLALIFAYGFSVTIAGALKAWVAKRVGDHTAEYAGYLTLDPLMHVDLIGMIALIFSGFGWGRNVPVSIENIRHPHRSLKMLALFYSSTFMHVLISGLAIISFAALLTTEGSYFSSTVFGRTIILMLQELILVNAFLAMLRFIQSSMELIFMHAVELHPEYGPYIELGSLIGSLVLMIFLGARMQLFFLRLAMGLSALLTSLFFKLFSWV